MTQVIFIDWVLSPTQFKEKLSLKRNLNSHVSGSAKACLRLPYEW
jgi:hypothetical protein